MSHQLSIPTFYLCRLLYKYGIMVQTPGTFTLTCKHSYQSFTVRTLYSVACGCVMIYLNNLLLHSYFQLAIVIIFTFCFSKIFLFSLRKITI